jgi:hypothetical protein
MYKLTSVTKLYGVIFSRLRSRTFSARSRASSASTAEERSATVTRYPHPANQDVRSGLGQGAVTRCEGA